jgi:hypothetical protein
MNTIYTSTARACILEQRYRTCGYRPARARRSRSRAGLRPILGGRDGILDSHDTRRRLAQVVPHASVRMLPDAGHYLPGQTTTILDFLHTTTGARRNG